MISKKIQLPLIGGFVLIFLAYITWGMFTFGHRNELFQYVGLVFLSIWFFLYILYRNVIKNNQQLIVLNHWITFLTTLVGIFYVIRFPEELNIIYVIAYLLILCCFAIQSIKDRIKGNIVFSKQWGIYILLVVVCILCFDENMYQFKWDGLLYYRDNANIRFTSISSMALYGHISQGYGILIRLMTILIGDVGWAMILSNIGCLLMSTYYFYKILELYFTKKNTIFSVLGAAIYGMSPFFLGMVNYHNLDFMLQCMVPIVIYYLIKKQWIYFLVASFFFCFTKEPAIVIYGAICLGTLIIDLKEKEKLFEKIRRIFTKKEYYIMLMPIVLWVMTFLILGPWTAGEGGTDLDYIYILEKLKVLYILNFNWIFVLIIIIGFIFKRNELKKYKDLFLVLWTMLLIFTIFSCVFKTVNHPRYSDSTMFCLYLMAIIVLVVTLPKLIKRVLMLCIVALMLLSTYRTIDPISKLVFDTVNIGNTTMISTQTPILGDGMIYNRQMLWMEGAVEQVIKEALKASDIIMMPALEDSTYFFDGIAEVANVEGTYCVKTQFWDTNLNKRSIYPNDNTIELQNYSISQSIGSEELQKEIYMLPAIFITGDFVGPFFEESNYEEYESFYRGWNLKGILLNRQGVVTE